VKKAERPDRFPAGTYPAGKEPYERPRITFREPLEAVAAVCFPPIGKPAAPCLVAFT